MTSRAADRFKVTLAGMTLVEVLIALLIFTMSFLVIIDSQNMNIRNAAYSRRITLATMLAQKKMAEVRMKYKGVPLGEIKEKEEGEFEGEYKQFRWEETTRKFNYDLSFLIDLAKAQEGGDEEEDEEEEPESPLFAYLPKITEYIQSSVKEVTITVYWKERGAQRHVSLTTHLFNYKEPIQL